MRKKIWKRRAHEYTKKGKKRRIKWKEEKERIKNQDQWKELKSGIVGERLIVGSAADSRGRAGQ